MSVWCRLECGMCQCGADWSVECVSVVQTGVWNVPL